jgi:hypothetical protein
VLVHKATLGLANGHKGAHAQYPEGPKYAGCRTQQVKGVGAGGTGAEAGGG